MKYLITILTLIFTTSVLADIDDTFLLKLRKEFVQSKNEEKAEAGKKLIAALQLASTQAIENEDSAKALSFSQEAYRVGKTATPALMEFLVEDVKVSAYRNRFAGKIRLLKSKITDNPTKEVDELVVVFIQHWDVPKLALKYVDLMSDDKLKEQVFIANKKINELDKTSLTNLADWYKELSDKAQGPMDEVLLIKAKAIYQHVLSLAEGKEEELRLADALSDVNKELGIVPQLTKGSTPIQVAKSQSAFDALAFLDFNTHTVKGKWERKGRSYVRMSLNNADEKWARADFPIEVSGDYTIEANVTVQSGICKIYFPVGNKELSLAFAKMAGSAYSVIRGKEWLDKSNPTRINENVLDANYNAEIKINVTKQKDNSYLVHSLINSHELKVLLTEDDITTFKDKKNEVKIWGYGPDILFHKLLIKTKNGKVTLK